MRKGFTLIEMLIVVVIIGILMGLLLPAVIEALNGGKDGRAEVMISDITLALSVYWQNNNTYPAGDGSGSKQLAEALSKVSSRSIPYYEFKTDEIDGNGNIVSPVAPENFFYYRYPGSHNKRTFDLWTKNSAGVEEGIKNW